METKHPVVYIVGGDHSVTRLLKEYGFVTTIRPEVAELVIFTGGADINPQLYGEEAIPETHCNLERDDVEVKAFNHFKDVPKVGICRGGQLLNVLSGGKMFQHVTQHTREHDIFPVDGGKAICRATSTHHQMMIPGPNAQVLAIANESNYRKSWMDEEFGPHDDLEVVYYDATKSLCFQPHPEYNWASKELKDFFFDCIRGCLGVYSTGPFESTTVAVGLRNFS